MRPAARIRGASARGARLTAATPRRARPTMRPALTPAAWGAASPPLTRCPLRSPRLGGHRHVRVDRIRGRPRTCRVLALPAGATAYPKDPSAPCTPCRLPRDCRGCRCPPESGESGGHRHAKPFRPSQTWLAGVASPVSIRCFPNQPKRCPGPWHANVGPRCA
jgi:hypothetical protein